MKVLRNQSMPSDDYPLPMQYQLLPGALKDGITEEQVQACTGNLQDPPLVLANARSRVAIVLGVTPSGIYIKIAIAGTEQYPEDILTLFHAQPMPVREQHWYRRTINQMRNR